MCEILFLAAAIANIAELALELWREYKHMRMEKGDKEGGPVAASPLIQPGFARHRFNFRALPAHPL